MFQHWLGLDGSWTTDAWGGCISCLGLFATPFVLLRKHQCEVSGCWRIGKHSTDGGHAVCARHHPTGAPSAQDVIDKHEGARNGN